MTSIPEYMTEKHRECDDIFTEAESSVSAGNWELAQKQWREFSEELALHLEAEESILFPQFEQATGMTSGPTYVMRGEHEQMRALVADLDKALASEDKTQFLGLSETLMVLMQQHNMKEEMMLYPMTQQSIPDAENLAGVLKAHCEPS
ncbi:hemerythrin domain-containing protein [Thalassotalea sp. PLHSN55]|uniref:hemerythrin domain-containing protein n=1 Tax=Thalassotalea sp. PLHSN55 TaxID=3435888 RepID=UPI003F8304D4